MLHSARHVLQRSIHYSKPIILHISRTASTSSRKQEIQKVQPEVEKAQGNTQIQARASDAFFDDVMAGGPRPPVQIDAVLEQGRGFQLSTGVEVPTPVFVLNGEAFLWRPRFKIDRAGTMSFDAASFGILDVSSNKPEMLLLGTGKRNEFVNRDVRDYLHNLGIQVDTMDSRNAASTFNVLAAEGRSVALAVLLS